MGQRRIGYTAEESLLLTVDRGSVIAYEPALGSLKWTFSVEKVNIVSVVYASTTALPSDVAAGPWRSPSSASTAVALDSAGVLHALDAVLGRELGTVPHEGEPVTLASGGDALAVGFEDRVLLYRAGAKHEIRKKCSALSFSRDGLTLAIGTAKGELFFVDVGSREVTSFEPPVGGNIADVVPRPGGGWLVSSERGLTAVYSKKNEKQLNGMVAGAAVDAAGKRLAVRRSEANVVLYDWPPTVPVGRINASGGTIRDIAFGPDDKLGVAMAGGGAAMIDPGTLAVRRTGQRPEEPRAVWLVEAESEADRNARTEEQSRRAQAHEPKSGMGARLGIGGIISIALLVIRLFLVGARASTPAWTPPPNFGNIPRYSACDHACALDRLIKLETQCRETKTVDCSKQAKAAVEAFKKNDCAKTRRWLSIIELMNDHPDGGRDALVGADQLIATTGLSTACLLEPPHMSHYELTHLAGPDHTPTVDSAIALPAGDQPALWAAPDGAVFVATWDLSEPGKKGCSVHRQVTRDSPWTFDLQVNACSSVALFGRSSSEVYVSFGDTVRRFNGTTWEKALELDERVGQLAGNMTPGGDVYALGEHGAKRQLFQINGKTAAGVKKLTADPNIQEIFSGESLWAYGETTTANDLLYRWNGSGWSRRATVGDAGVDERTFRALWQSPGGHLFIAKGDVVSRSTNDGATWEETELSSSVNEIWGRSNTDVYASGYSGIQHFDGKTWEELDFSEPVVAISGDAKDLHVLVYKR